MLYVPFCIAAIMDNSSAKGTISNPEYYNSKTRLMFGLLTNWYKTPYVFGGKGNAAATAPTMFLASYIMTAAMLFVQCIVILNVARDKINVFWDEHINSNISKFLEKKKHGLDNKFVYKKQTDGTDSLDAVGDNDGTG